LEDPSRDAIFHNYRTLKEIEKIVGIETYSTPELDGINGIYKYSYKDFLVREILEDGKILEIGEDSSGPSFSAELKDRFTIFNLIKINKNTFKAIRSISRALKIPFEKIKYSGLKDKCSISIQRASIRGNYIDRLRKLKIRDVFVRNILPSKNGVNLGSNWGNNFNITIRKIEKDNYLKEKINLMLTSLMKHGFPNYYGLQRFGYFRPNSHLLGRYLLENRHKEVFNEFVLNTYPTESLEAQKLREDLRKNGDLEKAYNSFPKGLDYERMMIKYLMKHDNDYEGAVDRLPSYLIKLLISSFQSFLFNKLVSLRIKKGISLFEPEKGDTISILDDDNGKITNTKYIYGGLYDDYLNKALKLNRAAIVIPLIGYDTNLTEFPLMRDLFFEVLKEAKIDREIYSSELLTTYEFKGSLRSMIVKPIGLKILELDEDDIFPNTMKLKIEFSLQKGSYATIFLRELIKSSID